MAALDDIKSSLDVNQLAGMVGADPAQTEAAVDAALGSLISTMGGKVDSVPEAESLATALAGHVNSDAYADRIDVAAIDTADGEKIVSHVYEPGQIQQLSGAAGGLVERLLPILAPIVMSYLAKQFNGVIKEKLGVELPTDLGGAQSQQSGGGMLGDLLGSILGGGAAAAPAGAGNANPAGSMAGSLLKEILLGR